MRYKYKKPRRFNLVSTFLLLVALTGAYLGWKFIPPYWQAWKVDDELNQLRNESADLSTLSPEHRDEMEGKIISRALDRVHALGVVDVPDFPVAVSFSPGYGYLVCRYRVVVKHPFVDRTTTLDFTRRVKLPSNKAL